MVLNLSQYINLLVQNFTLVTLAKLVVILKLELRDISKIVTSLIFLNNYTPHQHALTGMVLFLLKYKINDKDNSKFDLKIKEALHINWTKPNLNAQQNHLALILSLQLAPPLCLFLFLVFPFLFYLLFSLILIISIFYCLNYALLLLHLIITHLVNRFLITRLIEIDIVPLTVLFSR